MCEASGSWKRQRNGFSLRLWSPVRMHEFLSPAPPSNALTPALRPTVSLDCDTIYLPGGSIRSHRVRAPSHKTSPIRRGGMKFVPELSSRVSDNHLGPGLRAASAPCPEVVVGG